VYRWAAPAQHPQHRVRKRLYRHRARAAALDASVGGIGGCPFAPKATGNIVTEDLLYLLDREGIEAGADLDEVIRVAQWLEKILNRQLTGQLYRAGPFTPR
jgi:isopropylmalate/homocitrate/citramalate synthase